ncbi:AbrB family transcriptional regulator [Salinibacillus xinjiangensis]|uniref:AbrB family transcriptional regulator n=1 Tax=Salinibacillus xinjiangensis TaxID=1229268 RepID=A0A6G1X1T6_9BACI|nr:AbrB family transcriptional regulator [Salinibacillus xinjiangensis]MRG84860.1 hypothetical protein [Salinibacillus xinjiangensis]
MFSRISLSKEKIHKIIYTLIVGLIGGYLFSILSLPLSWILGPMVFTIITNITFKEVYLPTNFKLTGFFLLGISMGLYFEPETGGVIYKQFVFVVLMSILILLFGVINGAIHKKLSKLNWQTTIFGNIPGGTAQMIEVGGDLGGDREAIAIQQFTRLVLVVMVIPTLITFFFEPSIASTLPSSTSTNFNIYGIVILLFLGVFGWIVARFLKIPLPTLTGPLIMISTFSLLGVPFASFPPIFLNIAQVFIGISIGTYFNRSTIRDNRKYFIYALIGGVTLLAMCFLAAMILIFWANLDYPTAILSIAPGGIAEMSLTAAVVGANVPIVISFQIFRMFLFITLVPKLIGVIMIRVEFKKEKISQQM